MKQYIYLQIPKDSLNGIPDTALKLYAYLCSFKNSFKFKEEIKVYPTIRMMMEDLNISKSQCLRHLKILVELGWIERKRNENGNNNIYSLGTIVDGKEQFFCLDDDNPIPQKKINGHTGMKRSNIGVKGEPVGVKGEPIDGVKGEPNRCQKRTQVGVKGEPSRCQRTAPIYYNKSNNENSNTLRSTMGVGVKREPNQNRKFLKDNGRKILYSSAGSPTTNVNHASKIELSEFLEGEVPTIEDGLDLGKSELQKIAQAKLDRIDLEESPLNIKPGDDAVQHKEELIIDDPVSLDDWACLD